MEFKELGATGVKIPDIGLGTWQYRGGEAPIKQAVKLGACLIDTAEMYGSEEAVGAAIKGMREKVVSAEKVSRKSSALGPGARRGGRSPWPPRGRRDRSLSSPLARSGGADRRDD